MTHLRDMIGAMSYPKLERHYPQRVVGVQPISDPSILADQDVYLFLFLSEYRSMGSKY